jgi:hypothetical protein
MAGIGPIEMLIVLMLGGLGMPLGLPPLPEDPALAHAAPAECLFYSNWSGTAAADPQSPNRTERLLAEPEVQDLARALDQAIVQSIRASAGPTGPRIEEAFDLVKLILSRPTAVYVTRFTPPSEGSAFELEAGLIVNTGEARQQVEQSLNNLLRSAGLQRADGNAVEIDGVCFQQLPLPAPVQVLWGFHQTHLLVAIGRPVAEQMVAGLKLGRGPPPWLVQLRRELPIERVASVSYYDLAKARGLLDHFAGPRGQRILDSLGLANAESFATVTGLDSGGMASKTRIQIAGQPKGMLALTQARPLTRADLTPVPRDATLAMVMRLDPETAVAQFNPFLNELDPALRREIERHMQPEALGFDAGRLACSLGDVWCLYSSPGEGGLVATGLTLVVPVRDRPGVQQAMDGVAFAIRKAYPPPDMEDMPPGQRRRQPVLGELTFRGQQLWTLDLAAASVPLGPSWCLSDRELIVTLYPQTLKAYLSRAAGDGSLADVSEVAQALAAGTGPVSITYQDTRTLFRTLYPVVQTFAPLAMAEARRGGLQLDASILPSAASIDKHLAPGVSSIRSADGAILLESRQVLPWGGAQFSSLTPVAAVALVPAVSAARESARRAQATNNLKQIGLAMHNYHDAYQHLPAPANYDKQGKPLLSWRVHILPYIEGNALYEEFHLDEPWDSEHNRKLIARMPAVYKSPTGETIEPGKTAYLLPRGKGTLFERNRGPTFAEVLDGLSNTLMAVEAAPDRAVVWTRPEDLSYDPEQPLAGLSGLHKNVFLALYGDGSVQAISDKVDPKLLKALFTRQGGEAVRRP